MPSMDFNLDQRTIMLAVTGSHAYGTARPTSDIDIRGCCIAPLSVRISFYQGFDQFQAMGKAPPGGPNWDAAIAKMHQHETAGPIAARTGSDDLDLVIFDLGKLVNLCANANPNMLELLFLDPREVLFAGPAWEKLRANKALFLTRKVKYTYLGYANSQLKRIKLHRAWLLNPPSHAPTRGEFDLPESTVLSADDRNRIDEAIQKIIRGWGVEDMDMPGAERDVLRENMREFWSTQLRCAPDLLDEKMYELAATSIGLSKDVLSALRQERRYRAARKQWDQYKRWERERNPKRAALEAQHGYDTKHGMHLIRLMRTGLEVLQDGELRVRRPDAKELLSIREGHYSYDDLIAESQKLEAQMNVALTKTQLPKGPDREAIDRVLHELLVAAG